MLVKPTKDRILIKPDAVEKVSQGGIFIPTSVKNKPVKGTAIEVGPGIFDENGNRIPVDVQKGDSVVYIKDAGEPLDVDGIEHLLITEDQIIAIIGRSE